MLKASHILVPEEATCQTIRAELAQDHTRFGELAAKHSLCPSGKGMGGSLGTFQSGQMVPAFEEAAFAQSLGEIGECVATPFGQHLIRVEERRR